MGLHNDRLKDRNLLSIDAHHVLQEYYLILNLYVKYQVNVIQRAHLLLEI